MQQNYSVKIINLKYREDRKNAAIQELNKIGIKEYSFIEAVHKLGSRGKEGAIGCAMSHAKALMEFLIQDDTEYCLIFEDDFMVNENQFDDKINVSEVISRIINYPAWHVFLLAHWKSIPVEHSKIFVESELSKNFNAFRVFNAITCCAYIVKRSYAPKLIKCFLDSANYLVKFNNIPSPIRETIREHIACDTLWRPLQIEDYFVAIKPQLIIQRPSFSDIEQMNVEYNH